MNLLQKFDRKPNAKGRANAKGKPNGFEEEQSKCSNGLSFSKSCKFVQSSHQNLKSFWPISNLSKFVETLFLDESF